MISAMTFGDHFLDRAGFLSLWIVVTIVASILYLAAIALARRVPTAATLILGIIIWGIAVWLGVRGAI